MFQSVLLSCFIFVVGSTALAFDRITLPGNGFDLTCTGQNYTTTIVIDSGNTGQFNVAFERQISPGKWSGVASGGTMIMANGTYNVVVQLPNLPTGTVYNTCRAKILRNGVEISVSIINGILRRP